MPERPKALALEVDPESLVSLRQAFPEWKIEVITGAATASLSFPRDLETADLLVLGVRDEAVETLSLCRTLRSGASQAQAPLLVLVLPAQDALVREALAAGADSCLVLPVHAKELVSMVARVRTGNRPGRHTLGLNRAQIEDPWRDDGGEA